MPYCHKDRYSFEFGPDQPLVKIYGRFNDRRIRKGDYFYGLIVLVVFNSSR